MNGKILRHEGVIGTLPRGASERKENIEEIGIRNNFNPIFMCGTPTPEQPQYVGAAGHEHHTPGENQYLEKHLRQTNNGWCTTRATRQAGFVEKRVSTYLTND